MPSLPQQVIPAVGIIRIQLQTRRGLAVLKVTNESANAMQYITRAGMYGDPIPINGGSCAYHYSEGDRPKATFQIAGTPADTFAVYYEERD